MPPSFLSRDSILQGFLALAAAGGLFASPTDQTLYSHGNPTEFEQLLLERINQTRANPAATASRLKVSLSDKSARQPLVFHPALVEASRSHSEYLRAKNKFTHTGAGNTSAIDRMQDAGYVFGGGYHGWGENLGLSELRQLTPEQAVHKTQDNLFKSGPHRQWILEPYFREVGLGIVFGNTKVSGARRDVVIVTENFALSGASPSTNDDGSFLQGVVYDDRNGNHIYDLGEGVPNITITPSVGRYFSKSSTSGGYAIPMANHAGLVTLTITGEGFAPYQKDLTMKSNHNAKADVRLQDLPPLPPPPPAENVVEPDPLPEPGPHPPTAPVVLDAGAPEVLGVEGRNLVISLPNAGAAPMILEQSFDLIRWTPVTEGLSGKTFNVPLVNGRRAYFRCRWGN